MTLSALLAKAAREIDWKDITGVVNGSLEEAPQFELKRELSANTGQTDPWMAGSGKVGRPATDDLAKEIVALANSQGGLIVVGIDETDDKPARAAKIAEKLVPKCIECAERISDAMLSLIDPRLPGLSIRGIERPGGSGEGVLVLHVPRSTYAPHGFATPPKSYVRRGHRSDPMTMSELQSVLWDTRTKASRISDTLAQRRLAFIAMSKRLQSEKRIDEIRPRYKSDTKFANSWIGFRGTVVFEDDPNIDVRELFKASPFKASTGSGSESASAFERFSLSRELVNRPRAVWLDVSNYNSVARWVVGSNGLIEVAGFYELTRAPAEVWPGWFVQSAWELCCLLFWYRTASGSFGRQFVFDGDVIIDGDVKLHTPAGYHFMDIVPPENESQIGPLLLSSDQTVDDVFSAVQMEVLYAFGADERFRDRTPAENIFQRMGIIKPT